MEKLNIGLASVNYVNASTRWFKYDRDWFFFLKP